MSVTDSVIEKIRDLIVTGQIQPGDRLPPEQELATRLSVSRSSLREAVRALSQANVLDVRRGDGTYVTSLEPQLLLSGMSFVVDLMSDSTLVEVFEVRRLLEPAATALAAQRITRSHLKHLYWTFGQMLAHHSSNGCNMNPGDLIGSGTISGPTDESRACITEITEAGKKPLKLSSGESRTALEDGDEITLSAWAKKEGHVSIGFGQCVGTILSANGGAELDV